MFWENRNVNALTHPTKHQEYSQLFTKGELNLYPEVTFFANDVEKEMKESNVIAQNYFNECDWGHQRD